MKNFLTFTLAFFYFSSLAQDTCNCLDNLSKTIDKVSKNYAGFADKVTPQNDTLYYAFVDSLKRLAPQNNIDSNCFKILKSYTNFFKDGHLGISFLKKRTSNNSTSAQLKVDNDIPSISFRANKWAIIKIASFSIDYNDTIHKLFTRYTSALENCEYWIIDVRGNDGGSSDVYAPVLPYLFTNPIITEGARQWCSAGNVKAAREEFDDYKDQVDSLTRIGWEKNIVKQEANIENWMASPGDTIIFNQVKKHPQKVAIIIDHGCASSTEIFIMKARQSKKVTLWGTNTNGTVDYGDVKYWDDLPYKPFNVRIATTRWNWIDKTGPIDITGIEPNIKIPVETTDWISYVRQHLNDSTTK